MTIENCWASVVYPPRALRFLKVADLRHARCAIWISHPCRLLVAASVAIVSLAARDVQAASLSSAREFSGVPHDCKCATKCRGDSCCCGPHHPQAPAPARVPTKERGPKLGSPCQFNSTPGGDRGIPMAPSGSPVSKSASLVTFANLRLDTACCLLLYSAPSLLPARRASRLDRPPERPDLA
jgi:hypothetical protein